MNFHFILFVVSFFGIILAQIDIDLVPDPKNVNFDRFIQICLFGTLILSLIKMD